DFRSPGQPLARFERVTPVNLSEQQMNAYAGVFTSPELDATYRISVDGANLVVDSGDPRPQRLRSAGPDLMRRIDGGGEYVFRRDRSGAVAGFELNVGSVRKLRF